MQNNARYFVHIVKYDFVRVLLKRCNIYPMEQHSERKVFQLYKRRWYMLAVVAVFNLSNAMLWLTFAPVANFTASYFAISETQVNWFSLAFFIVFVPCCAVSWWFMETYGFKTAIIWGSVSMCLGALLRVVGVLAFRDPLTSYIVTMAGQVLSAISQPLVLSMPTKLAALWFGDHERTVANTIASMSNPLGVLLANALAVVLVSHKKDIPNLVIAFAVPSVIGALMAIFGCRTSAPPTPPSSSAEHTPESFFIGLKHVLRNKQFMLLAFATGIGIGSFSAVSTILEQLICPFGYSNTTAGLCGAMIIVGGFLGSALMGVYVDRTRNYIDVSKIMGMLFALASVAVAVFSTMNNQTVLVVISFTLFGLFALGILPVMLELGVECTYPVDETTSAGIQWAIGQFFGVIMLVVSMATAPQLTAQQQRYSVCNADKTVNLKPVDLTVPVFVICGVSVVVLIAYVAVFDTPLRRLEAEQEAQDKRDDALLIDPVAV